MRTQSQTCLTRFVAGVLYDLPFGKGQLISAGNWTNQIIGGWQLNVPANFPERLSSIYLPEQ